MRRGLWITLLVGCLAFNGCAGEGPSAPEDASAEWRGTVETEGDVTTVVNESGSLWGGDARLEEEVTIGVESGEEPYMFGLVTDVWASDARVLVADAQVVAVRVYDDLGRHLFDLGREGEGPGEFADGPVGVAVDADGRILVAENNREIEVFSADGESLETWRTGGTMTIHTRDVLVPAPEGRPWIVHGDMEAFRAGDLRLGRIRIGPEGTEGEPVYGPDIDWESACLTYTRQGRESKYCAIPFQPAAFSTFAPSGAWVVGISDSYSFEVHHPDGGKLVVERPWEPVPVSPEEAEYRREQTTWMIRDRIGPDSGWTWNGPEIPDHKPAFRQLVPDQSGRVWVVREGPSRRSTDCASGAEECWVPEAYNWDAFGPDGRFLGSFSVDERLSFPFIEDDTVAAVTSDSSGTTVVKRYRLVLPGEER